jgi:AraC family transcriptional regulator
MPESSTHSFYEQCINRLFTYICQNAGRSISLDELSDIACFSKFHLLRIFKAITGETIGECISRIRIEKAAFFLLYNQSASVTAIALECGFSSSQNFAKAFKTYYGVTPGDFKKHNRSRPLHPDSNPGNIISNSRNETSTVVRYIDIINGENFHLDTDDSVSSMVSIKEYPDVPVVYIRKRANYTAEIIANAFRELYQWAFPRGICDRTTPALSLYWDNVAVTPMDKRRFDVCIQLDKAVSLSHPVDRQIIQGGLYAVYHSTIENFDFYAHWNRFLKYWFPSSGFIPDNRPCFERIYNLFDQNQNNPLLVDICVPVRKL